MAGLGSEGAKQDEEDTAEPLRSPETGGYQESAQALWGTAYLPSNADGLLRSDQAGCGVDVVIKFDCPQVGLRSIFKRLGPMQLSVFTWIVLLKFR